MENKMSSTQYTFELAIESLYEFFRPSKHIHEVNVEITNKGLHTNSMDSSQVTCISSTIPSSSFTKYPLVPSTPPLALTLDTIYLIPWLSKQKGPVTLTLLTNINPTKQQEIVTEIKLLTNLNGLEKEKIFQALSANKFPRGIKTKFTSSFILPASSIKETLKELKEANSSIQFNISSNELIFKDNRSIKINLSQVKGVTLNHNEPEPKTIVNFSKDYIINLFAAMPLTDILIQYQKACPMVCTYTIDNISHKIILAPVAID